ncbi:hypothetical protein CN327_17960 [Bacillus cereus]|uniref:Exosporium leader peptide-containing protein n=1 Tax=Bacillus nitratireducens TaxID=2026193 RepID=A0ABU6PFZ1_9BACI|nr:exosporium leader peptide [Bacillus cereus BAG1X1-3]EOO76858.1 exosporium leader peptide [Bacillus cereus BAG1O-1]MDR4173995.1 exosporium leader peptide-containing protein [Bacillus nitratireducens]PEA24533.1 hypothetical protein CON44_25265 [Bacillus cereus]MED4680214.1 exosporium leader peptide-containing protein [Bacillus nitratireducens]
MDEFLSFAALNPVSIGPTLPPVPPFQFPTGSTGFNLPAEPASIILTQALHGEDLPISDVYRTTNKQ